MVHRPAHNFFDLRVYSLRTKRCANQAQDHVLGLPTGWARSSTSTRRPPAVMVHFGAGRTRPSCRPRRTVGHASRRPRQRFRPDWSALATTLPPGAGSPWLGHSSRRSRHRSRHGPLRRLVLQESRQLAAQATTQMVEVPAELPHAGFRSASPSSGPQTGLRHPGAARRRHSGANRPRITRCSSGSRS
jgi:hypothetical protein